MARILIADDDDHILLFVSTCLESDNHEVITARNGLEALDMALDKNPDLIIMDMDMPELNGWLAVQAVRSIPSIEELPIIGLSAHTTSADRDEAHLAGCQIYLNKPFDVDLLLKTVRHFSTAA